MGGERKFHLVKWDTICSPKEVGGLGLRNLSQMNKALLGKWLWRYASEPEALWRNVIAWKYGQGEGDWWPKNSTRPHGVGVWKAIMAELIDFARKVKFKIGNGERVKFWTDKWFGNGTLLETFPFIYNLALRKEGWVSDFLIWAGDTLFWNVTFIRNLQDWEIEGVELFFAQLYDAKIERGTEDALIWGDKF